MTGLRIPATMGLFHPINKQKTPSECVPAFTCGISLWFAIAGGWHGNLLLRLRLFEVSHFASSVVGPVSIASHALASALLELRRANLYLGFAIPQAAPHAQGTPQRTSATQRNLARRQRVRPFFLRVSTASLRSGIIPAGVFIASPTSRPNAIGS